MTSEMAHAWLLTAAKAMVDYLDRRERGLPLRSDYESIICLRTLQGAIDAAERAKEEDDRLRMAKVTA